MPSDLIVALNGLVVVFVVSLEYVRRRARLLEAADRRAGERRRATPPAPASAERGKRMSQFFTSAILTATVASGIQLAAPFLLAALGETIGQRSGVINLGVDGIMLLGAFAAYYTALQTGSLVLAVLVGIGVGALLGLVTAVISVTLKAEQGISGIGVYLFALGFSDLLFLKLVGTPLPINQLLADRRSRCSTGSRRVGGMFFEQNVLVYLAFLLVPVVDVRPQPHDVRPEHQGGRREPGRGRQPRGERDR